MSNTSTPLHVPPWYYRLPVAPGGRRAIVIAADVLSAYWLVGASDPALSFVFESDRVQIQIGRPVIDAAMQHPDLPPDRRQAIADALVDLQRRGGMVITGASRMPPAVQRAHGELAVLLRASLRAVDAMVLADAIVTRTPLLTADRPAAGEIGRAMRSDLVQRLLASRGLLADPATVLIT